MVDIIPDAAGRSVVVAFDGCFSVDAVKVVASLSDAGGLLGSRVARSISLVCCCSFVVVDSSLSNFRDLGSTQWVMLYNDCVGLSV